MLLEAVLHDDADLALRSHSGVAVCTLLQHIGEGALHLAALHRELHVVGGLVAGDDLELQPEHVARHDGVVDAGGADADAAHDDLGGALVSSSVLIAGGVPDIADEGIGGDAADPGELVGIEDRGAGRGQRRRQHARMRAGDDGAVARRRVRTCSSRSSARWRRACSAR